MHTPIPLLLLLAACVPGTDSSLRVPFDLPAGADPQAEPANAPEAAPPAEAPQGEDETPATETADRRAAPEDSDTSEPRDPATEDAAPWEAPPREDTPGDTGDTEPPDEEPPRDGGDREPPRDEAAPESYDVLGTYHGYFCPEQRFITTEDISRDDALANCELNAAFNPDQSIRCTWNDEEILRREVTRGDCDASEPEPSTDAEVHACWRSCVDGAWPGLLACLDGGGEQDACHEAFYADVYACAEGCDGSTDPTDASDPAPDEGTCVPEGFTPATFAVPLDDMSCDGPGSMRYDATQGLWVGIVSCGPGTWRFYLSETADGPFLPAMDVAGHGQDHCELIDPSFTLPNEDDITSGSCPDCAIGWNLPLEGVAGWYRAFLGERFQYVEATGPWSYQVSQVTCGCGD